ncbi:conjugal transfer nickase/helicase domain-containing protein [Ectothiorhodospira shaposhnikovii]|uniref:conjugal transfer nickase/helicase domain-containing protein n=1 Tax=Ectothiorhodospira shaposhnikovii TaxID=1054 RepID=UPI001905DBEB|nr:DNA-binding domain-containing protein [Ectothiorhodospira shaposhnikovii]
MTPIEPSTPDTCSEQHPEPDITAPRMSADTIIMGQEETDERPPEDPGHAQAHDGLILTAQPPETAQGFNLPQAPSTDPGQQFLQWLRQEVSARHLDVNTPNARIHVVSEGVLLVSPAVFKDYAARHPDHPGWEYVQKRFIKLKLHQKQTDGTNVHRYLVRGARRQSVVKGILLPNPRILFPHAEALPAANPHLHASPPSCA